MRILLSIIALCFCVCLSYEAGAYVSYHYTNLVNNIKPNLIVRSKPTSQFIKIASVQFLTDGNTLNFQTTELDVKSRCYMAGYYKKQSDCTESGENYGVRCVDDENISFTAEEKTEAEQYVAGCCSKVYSVADPKDCLNNSYYSGNRCLLGKGQTNGGKWVYECVCNRSTYPYGEDRIKAGSDLSFNSDPLDRHNRDGKQAYFQPRAEKAVGTGRLSYEIFKAVLHLRKAVAYEQACI